MVKIQYKQTYAFMKGLEDGVIAFALEFKNYHDDFTTKYNTRAYAEGYQIGSCLELYKVWKSKPDGWRADHWLMRFCINNNRIDSTGYKLVTLINNNRFIEETDHSRRGEPLIPNRV